MELNVRKALEAKRISMRALASFLGVTEKTVQNKMNGKTDFTCPEAFRIKQELLPEYDIDYLFSPSDPAQRQ